MTDWSSPAGLSSAVSTVGIPPRSRHRAALTIGILAFAAVCSFGGLFGGPALGDHEAIVAECARSMRLSGDWIVPRLAETPFIRKPPLPYWLVAASSYVLPPEPGTGLPVSNAAARMPSAASAFGLILLLWHLASHMFGRRTGLVTAVVASTSVFVLLFAPNATAEMLLSFCCVWAFVHFWHAVTSRSRARQAVHMTAYYLALGAGMLAKGPAPMALVAVPIAVWWYTYRPQRLLARGGKEARRLAVALFLRGLRRQTVRAFTRLWLIPGVFLFLATFLPWMFAVGERFPVAWKIWDWQYLQRFQGDYEDTKSRGPLYYVPIVLGLLAPWTLWLFTGLAAPWLHRYRALRREMYFLGIAGAVGVATMSAMEFKKPYYVLPAVPLLVVLLAVPLERMLREARPRARGVMIWGGLLVAAIVIGVIGWSQTDSPWSGPAEVLIGLAFAAGVGGAAWLFAHRRSSAALGTFAAAMAFAFQAGWHTAAAELENVRRVAVLDEVLDHAGVPADAPVYFADQRPDARLPFYFERRAMNLVTAATIVQHTVDRTDSDLLIRQLAFKRADEVLADKLPAYLVLDREHLGLLSFLDDEVEARLVQIGEIDLDKHPDDDDWIVLSNTPPAKNQSVP